MHVGRAKYAQAHSYFGFGSELLVIDVVLFDVEWAKGNFNTLPRTISQTIAHLILPLLVKVSKFLASLRRDLMKNITIPILAV